VYNPTTASRRQGSEYEQCQDGQGDPAQDVVDSKVCRRQSSRAAGAEATAGGDEQYGEHREQSPARPLAAGNVDSDAHCVTSEAQIGHHDVGKHPEDQGSRQQQGAEALEQGLEAGGA
jgi:hypothetical protein